MNYTYYRRYRARKKQSSFRSFFWLVFFLVIIALLVRACVSVVNVFVEAKRNEAVLTINKGSAEVILWGQDSAETAANSQIILEGDSVKTGSDSIVSLKFYNGTELHLDEDSHMIFTEMLAEEDSDLITIDLLDGRAWLDHLPKEKGQMDILLRTDVMNINSMSGQYLVSNNVDDEYIYVFDGQMSLEFVERGDEDTVIESAILSDGDRSFFDDDKERDLISRENVLLVEEYENELLGDTFVMWNVGTLGIEDLEDEEEDEIEETEEEMPEEEVVEEEEEEEVVEIESLVISVSSPESPITVQEDAIAIEGRIVSGEASSVTVTWSGNGQAYPLGLFEAGDESFRYVADVEYLNFASGENTYTIVAYDADGNASNVLIVEITGEF